MKVEREYSGTVHHMATCYVCGWQESIGEPGVTVRKITEKAKKHVQDTGHPVDIETAKCSRYVVNHWR